MNESAGEKKLRAYLEKATTALKQTKQRLQELEAEANEPIAIVAMACRFPGGINSPEQLWQALDEGRDMTSPFPEDRGWPPFEQLYDPNPDAVGKTYTRGGGFVDNPALFDGNFFGISPREAAGIDPQQRLLLELSWEVLERAGIVPATLFESQTGVFVGVTYDDYIGITPPAIVAEDGYGTLGNLYSICSGRISYTLGLVGPALTVDTACSTSLVNVHLAVSALRKGECDLALAGGATVFSTPDPLISFSRLRTVSTDGRCRAFSDTADGAGWGEGAALLVLERLSDAQKNGHEVLAIVRSSAVNQDGRSQGLTAPNGPSQQRVIRAALAAGKLSAADVDVIEAHGTGTSLGDPIEAHALLATYGREHSPERPVWLGTIKSNIAHTQGAAGVAGIMKLVLALQQQRLPATLFADPPSAKIDWSSGTLRLATEAIPWAAGERTRRGAVSSFGISGTNAHVIIEEAPASDLSSDSAEPTLARPHPGALPLLISGKTPAALRANAERLRAHIEAHPQRELVDLVDLGFSLATTRTHFEVREAIVAEDRESALAELARVAATGEGVYSHGTPKLAVLFSGQGSQHPGMGRELHERHPVFRAALDQICAHFDALLDTPLAPIVFASVGQPSAALIHRTAYTQPALFCFEVALYRLLESWGVRPDLLLGHSIGELTAAHIAGVFSLADACKLVAARGRLMQALPEGGAMISIQAAADEVRAQLERHAGKLDIAGVNGPLSTVIAGDEQAALELADHFAKLGRKTKQLTVSHAFHSPRMDPMLDEFHAVVASVEAHAPKIPIVSNLTGALASADELRSPSYWVRHVRQAVLFFDGIRALERQGAGVLLELGPHGVLSSMANACLSEQSASTAVIASQHRERPEHRSLIAALAELHRHGVAVDWNALLQPFAPRRVPLPTYAFQGERCWVDPGKSTRLDARAAGLDVVEHPVLSASVSVAHDDSLMFTARLSLSEQAWLGDHRVFDHVLVPGTALLELAATAGERLGGLAVEELELSAPLALAADEELALQIAVSPVDQAGRRSLSIHSRPCAAGPRAWSLHASGSLAPASTEAEFEFSTWPPPRAAALELTGFYEQLASMGLDYGPGFRGLRRAWKRDADYWAEVALDEGRELVDGFAVHPALLDAALHVLVLGEHRTLLPFVWSRAHVLATGASTLRVRLSPTGSEGAYALQAADSSGAPVLVAQLMMRPASAANVRSALARRDQDALYRVAWIPIAAPSARVTLSAVVGEQAPGFDDLPRRARIADLDGTPERIVLPRLTPTSPLDDCTTLLAELRTWLEDDRFAASTLVVVTHRAIATATDEDVLDLGHASLWGLLRAAQAEHPDRSLAIVDVDAIADARTAALAAIASNEPQLAMRAGELLVPRLQSATDPNTLLPPLDAAAWHLDSTSKGLLDNLVFVPAPELLDALGPSEVRIEVKATGLNFRDVLNALGMYPGDPGPLGYEGAGVVTAIGANVSSLALGDRVMGTLRAGFGSHAVVDHRLLVRIPSGWSFTRAASVPLVFLTAYYAFVDLAQLRAGERVLIHAAAGGVGMAATQLARHLGAEVYGTASEPKWETLRGYGFDDAHLASSRTLAFANEVLAATKGEGVDVVLNALAREFVDASLRLLPRGGRFLEMGKTDVREPEQVASEFPGVTYKAFDLVDAGPDRIQEMLRELVALFERGVLEPLPIRSWDIRRVPAAFRYVAQAKHIGKVVIRAAPKLDRDGTILITGGTGGLGAVVARHLVDHHGARHLLLTSRRGEASPEAAKVRAELEAAGATVRIVACDVSNRAALAELLASVPSQHPLTAVIHAAGVIDDGLVTSLDSAQLERVFKPKVDAATHLHELTRELDLARFVLFSSVAGTIGTAGQANYAAANSYLDALAAHRHALGLPATSLAWGPWADRGMAARLSEADRARLNRGGMPPLAVAEGLALLDAALRRPEPTLVPVRLDPAALAERSDIPAIIRGLVRAAPRRAAARAEVDSSLAARLAKLGADEAERTVLELIRRETASVLGAARPDAIAAEQPLQNLGLDSLMAVELRNRLQAATGQRLPATLLFDFPTIKALCRYLHAELVQQPAAEAELRTEPARAIATDDDPVVIVGMACRYPGAIDSPEALWAMVDEGRDVVGPFPQDRGWALDRIYDPDPNHVGTTYARAGGFLEHPDQFDASFFGISPREAASIDPQQRLLLELSWEALERAGINPLAMQGTRSGVYVGICYDEYQKLAPSPDVAEDGYSVIGTAYAVVSGRISYFLGLQGPAVTLDTACSTSLVALHLAAQAIRSGECELALVGGATVFPTSDPLVYFSRLKALSPDGRCRAFSAQADGAGWAEGAGVLVIERLSDARRLGHTPIAIVRSTAVNQDGRSQGLTAPNGPAQQRVIRAALESAGLSPSDVDVVEAHGTGTKLGDPIEAQAIQATYGRGHSPEHPLWLGSIKSNMGHAQAAAGVAGVIKLALALEHERLPRTLHADEPSPFIDWSDGTVALLREPIAWPRGARPRRGAVSAFGISGTNAHVIIEEPPASEPTASHPASASAELPILCLPISAHTSPALRAQAQRLEAWLRNGQPRPALADLGYSLATTRAALEHRAVIVASSHDEALESLAALSGNRPAPGYVIGTSGLEGKLVFVFPGQGAQWARMAQALLSASPVFRASIEASHAALRPYTDWSLLDVLCDEGQAGLLERVDVVQPVLFAMMVALAAVWRDFGIVPDAVVGHSQGEIAAAHVAGALSLDDAAKIVALRSQVIASELEGGAMAAVSLPAEQLERRLEPYGDRLALAVDNGPASTVVSGDPDAVDELVATLEAEGIFARRVRVTYASHCARIESIREPLLDALADVAPRRAAIPMISTVDVGSLVGTELDASYWYRNLRQPVRFADAVDVLLDSGHRFYVEVSAHSVLNVALQGLLDARQTAGVVVSTLRRDEGGLERALLSFAELHTRGYAVDWARHFGPHIEPRAPRLTELPTYAFQRERFWLELKAGSSTNVASAGLSAIDHPLLRASTSLATESLRVLSASLSASTFAWLGDHRVFGRVVVPGVAIAELALAALASTTPGAATLILDELVLGVPLLLDDEPLHLQIILAEDSAEGARRFSIHSRPAEASDEAWIEHATGVAHAESIAPSFEAPPWPPHDAKPVDISTLHEQLAGLGLDYGPAFRGLGCAWSTADGEVYAEVELPERVDGDFAIHPALLDAALHTAFVAMTAAAQPLALALPFAFRELALYATGATRLRIRASVSSRASSTSLTLDAWDPAGRLVARLGALDSRPIAPAQLERARPIRHLYELSWQPLTLPAHAELPRRWALVGAMAELAPLANQLQRRGIETACWSTWTELTQALDGDVEAPEMLLRVWPQLDANHSIADAHDASEAALAELHDWVTRPALARTQLAVITHHAVGIDAHRVNLTHAPLLGLLRSARNEHPDRQLWSIDIDGPLELELLASLFAVEGDREFAHRGGAWLVPRLTPSATQQDAAPLVLGDGTVLITGGTGELGAQLARHLIREHQARHLLLISRRGPEAAGAAELSAELSELGAASVEIVRCDAADRDAVAALIAAIPAARPLRAVFHVAGVLEDALIVNLEPAQLHRVLRAKLDGAANLHELTCELDLAAFVSFSSTAGVLGNAGQANYAAANSFLDALAHERRARGLPGQSLAWGLWSEGGMIAHLDDADLARMSRQGVRALSIVEGMALLDAALGRAKPLLIPIKLHLPTLRRLEQVAPLLRVLAPVRMRQAERQEQRGDLVQQLAKLSASEREATLLELVSAEIRTILRLPELDSMRPLQELGLDSLMAVELRNQLQRISGLALPSTLVFDYPTAQALARMLLAELEQAPATVPIAVNTRSSSDEAIAIVGMACRYPGDVRDPESMWRLLETGTDAIASMPSDRGWPTDLVSSDPDEAGKSITGQGGFLYDAADFDPAFFGISPREAVAIDPQQRLLLAVSWEAIERAGIPPTVLQGSSTGVFVGVMYNDYAGRFATSLESLSGYIGIGSSGSVASGRIAYALGLEGPAVSVDTACSSSLVALHLACESLRSGECDLSLAGGVAIMATPTLFVEFSRQRGMAPDGRCKSFSAEADGAGWAEGVGMLVLERLSDAERNGHQVLALVRGSAVNQDGRSQGLTAPNGPSQQRVIRAALAAARLQPDEVDAVEAHGTGTRLGDPIEAQALIATYGRAHSPEHPLWLGSIKSNIGHAQAAAGVAGVIKMVLAMQHQRLPRTLHAEQATPHVDWSDGTVRLLDQARAWESGDHPRRAAVSSFGISGTNAHVILEQAPSRIDRAPTHALLAPAHLPLIFSGKTERAIREQVEQLRSSQHSALDVAWSLVSTRASFERRAVTVVESLEQLALDQLAISSAVARPKLALLFTGQGAQRLGMAGQLRDAYPEFRQIFDDICARFDALLDEPLAPVMFAEHSAKLDQTLYTQPALFTLEVALYRLLERWGLAPELLLGHSIGELVAAHVAGVFDLDDACKLVAARGRLMQALPEGGAMVSIAASEDEILPLLERHPKVDIAGLNGPTSTVISGDLQPVLELAAHFEAQGRSSKRLTVSHAFHSQHMDAMLVEFEQVAASITYHPPRIAIVSNVTGQLATIELCEPGYWVRHVRQAVRFLDGVRTLEAHGVSVCLELGPHGVLCSMAGACLSDDARENIALLPALRRDRPETETLALALGNLHCQGVALDWRAYFEPFGPKRVELPTYPFQRDRFWLEAPKPTPVRSSEPADDDFWTAVDGDDLDGLSRLLGFHEPEQHGRLAEILPSLSSWHRRQRQRHGAAAWRYAIRWTRLAQLETAPARGPSTLVVPRSLADAELPRALVRALDIAGLEPRVVILEPNATRERITALFAELPAAPSRVLSLLALDPSPHPEHRSLPLGLALNLALAQALTERPAAAPLWLLTQSAVSTDAGDPLENPAQAMTWGFGQTFSLEHPERFGGLLDLPAECDASLLARLPAVLARNDFEDQLALRSAGLFARRLSPAADLPANAHRFQPRGTALITGGTGALGAHVARALAREGIEQLVLTSRRGLAAPDAHALQAELEALGPRVSIVACDVGSRDAVAELLTQIDAEHAPLSIIVHAAGVSGDMTPIAQLTCSAFAQTLASKVDGAQHLHELTRGRQLDAFISFSSISATWGSGQQAAYASANTFLDALAIHRARDGQPATSIAWGPWADGGMADHDTVAYLGRRGLRPLAPDAAIGAFATALDARDVNVTLVDVDWNTFAPSYAAQRPRPLLAEIPAAAPERALDSQREATTPPLLDELRQLSKLERERRLLDLVLEQTAAVLGLAKSSLNPRTGFADLGLDSLMAVELRQRLRTATGASLPATLAFDHPSPQHIRDFLVSMIEDELDAEPEESSHEQSHDQLSDRDLRELLASMSLDKLRSSGLLSQLLVVAHEPADSSDSAFDGLDDDDLLNAADALLGDI